MKQSVMLACAAILALAAAAFGQDQPATTPPPLAAAVMQGQPGETDPARLRDALAGLDALDNPEALDDGASVAAIVRVLIEAAGAPGTRVALLSIEQGSPTVAAVTPGTLEMDAPAAGPLQWWNGSGVAYLLYHRGDDRPDAASVARSLEGLPDAFADHRVVATTGLELMLDLENLRRAWPQALADGPARRVVAATGLANARKVHLHVPESGAVRLAYSSRALPADRVTHRIGPEPAGKSVDEAVGVRWPALFDAGLKAYAIALEEEPRRAFGERFRGWMGVNGNRLRGILQATEVGMAWSVGPKGDGPRAVVTIPVRPGVQIDRLIEAIHATATDSGFEVRGGRALLTLPATVSAALGGTTLAVEVQTPGEAAVIQLTIE